MEILHCICNAKSLRIAYKSSLFKTIQSRKSLYNFFADVRKLGSKNLFIMHRQWIQNVLKLKNIKSNSTLGNYKLLSYNILSQDLLVEHIHLYCGINNELLRWESRLNKIKEEVSTIDPDILCLQEVQYDHLKELVKAFNTSKQNRKLEYVFKKKTGTRSDGCVIVYDRNKFKLIEEQNVEYYTVGVPILNRENIALMAKFQPTDKSDSIFIVSTTHLLYNPKREDVRISQVYKLVQAIFAFAGQGNNRVPVILTGDFNFTPNSRAFEILTAAHQRKMCSEGSQNAQNYKDSLVFEAIDFGNMSGASTYQDQWITVDYILKSRSENGKGVQINSIYQLPSVSECCRNGKIPNKFLGSDHFSLAINFKII